MFTVAEAEILDDFHDGYRILRIPRFSLPNFPFEAWTSITDSQRLHRHKKKTLWLTQRSILYKLIDRYNDLDLDFCISIFSSPSFRP